MPRIAADERPRFESELVDANDVALVDSTCCVISSEVASGVGVHVAAFPDFDWVFDSVVGASVPVVGHGVGALPAGCSLVALRIDDWVTGVFDSWSGDGAGTSGAGAKVVVGADVPPGVVGAGVALGPVGAGVTLGPAGALVSVGVIVAGTEVASGTDVTLGPGGAFDPVGVDFTPGAGTTLGPVGAGVTEGSVGAGGTPGPKVVTLFPSGAGVKSGVVTAGVALGPVGAGVTLELVEVTTSVEAFVPLYPAGAGVASVTGMPLGPVGAGVTLGPVGA